MNIPRKKRKEECIEKPTTTEPIGMCRCCGSLTKYRDINCKYYDSDQVVYSDMIKECFGIELTSLKNEVSLRLICVHCSTKLRDTWSFKQQVKRTEELFIQRNNTFAGTGPQSKQNPNWKHSHQDNDDFEELSDGFDEDLCPEQLTEYYSLGNGIESHNGDGYWSNGDNFATENVSIGESNATKRFVKRNTKKKATSVAVADDRTHIAHNASSIVRFSFACPFRNRFNHVMCHYCPRYFLRPDQLREHTLTHPCSEFRSPRTRRFVKIDITRIDCKLCPEKIDNLEDFKRHLVTVHRKSYFTESKDGVIPFRLEQNVNTCILCGDQFQQFRSLVKHMGQHFSNYVCETCGMGFMDEKGLEKHTPAHNGKRYTCSICDRSLKSEYTLQCHMKRFHESNPEEVDSDEDPPKKVQTEVSCHGCDMTFKSSKYLSVHVRKVHMNYRHVCQVCGQKFFTRFSLNNHMPTHTGERNFKCKVCDKTYPRLKTLKEHMRIHTNDRRYRCHICGQAFIQNCSLKGHMKSKHPEYR